MLDSCEEPFFIRSDLNGDDMISIGDVLLLLNHVFLGESISCADAADVNDDGVLGLTDALVSLSFQFLAGEAPPAPMVCGPDPSEDSLSCDTGCTVD